MADPFTLTIPTKRYAPSTNFVPISSENAAVSTASNNLAAGVQEGSSPILGAVVPAVMAAAATASVVISAHKLWSRYRLRKAQSCPDFNTMVDDSDSGPRAPNNVPPKGEVLRGPRVSPRRVAPVGAEQPHIPIASPNKDNAALRSSRSQNRSIREKDQYEKMREIGRGAFGVVYVGRHIRTGELVAIKEMEVQGAEELRTEFQIMEHLHHENIVIVKSLEIGKRHARLYLEWVAGGSLAEILRNRQIEDEGLLACYVRQILEGLAYLHEHNVLHRDIKPRNILVDHKGSLKLTDFGLSRHLASMQDKTKCAGTPIYMAPEVMHGRFSVGSDIWALGATMSEMVTGKLPWSHIDPAIFGSQVALMMHIAKFQGERGHHPIIPNTLSAEAADFMSRCFAPDPNERGTCRELLQHPFLREDGGAASGMGSPAVSGATARNHSPRTSSKNADSTDSNSDGFSSDGEERLAHTDDSPAAPNTATFPTAPPLLSPSQRGMGGNLSAQATSTSPSGEHDRSPSREADSGTPGPVGGSIASVVPKI